MNIMRKQRQERNRQKLREILLNKSHEELVEQYQKLQQSTRETAQRLEEEKKVIIEDRNRLEAELYCSKASIEGIQSALINLLDQHRRIVSENIRLQNQTSVMQVELENRQNQLNELNAAENVQPTPLSEMSNELIALAGD